MRAARPIIKMTRIAERDTLNESNLHPSSSSGFFGMGIVKLVSEF